MVVLSSVERVVDAFADHPALSGQKHAATVRGCGG